MTQSLNVQAVPFAMYADTLQGLTPDDLVKVDQVLPAAACTTTQTPYWDSANDVWACQNIGTIAMATSAADFSGNLAGDVTGTQAVTSVVKIQGRDVAATAPTNNQVLMWNGSAWAPADEAGGGGSGTVTEVTSANSYLGVATGTTTPVLTLNVGTAANTVAAGDDSRITGALQSADYFTHLADADTCSASQKPSWNSVSDNWECLNIGSLDAAAVSSGSFDVARIPAMDAAKISSGSFDAARIPNLDAAKIVTGTIAAARLGSGTADNTTFLRGDGTWSVATDPNAIVNGGNTFGSAATIGTSDNFALNFETNDLTRMTILNDGNVGIGTASPAAKSHTVHSSTATTGTIAAQQTDLSWSPSGNAFSALAVGNYSTTAVTTNQSIGAAYGTFSSLSYTPSAGASTSQTFGGLFDATASGSSGGTGQLTGLSARANFNITATGNIGNATGLYGLANINSNGSLGTSVGGDFQSSTTAAGAWSNNSYGVRANVNTSNGLTSNAYGILTNVTRTGTGSVTTGYGLYIGAVQATTPYSIYSSSATAPSYFAGNVGLGTTTPMEKLDVSGAIKIGDTSGTADGTLRWTGTDFEGRKAGAWVSLTSVAGGSGTVTEVTSANSYLGVATGTTTPVLNG